MNEYDSIQALKLLIVKIRVLSSEEKNIRLIYFYKYSKDFESNQYIEIAEEISDISKKHLNNLKPNCKVISSFS